MLSKSANGVKEGSYRGANKFLVAPCVAWQVFLSTTDAAKQGKQELPAG